MARLVTTVQRYLGTAAERAALVTANINPGSTFFETDTGLLYFLNGATPKVWVLKQTTVTGAVDAQVTGSIVAEVLTEADAMADVLTFAANIAALEIYHGELTAQEFEVNGITLHVAPGGWRSPVGGVANDEVTIPAGVSCVVSRLV